MLKKFEKNLRPSKTYFYSEKISLMKNNFTEKNVQTDTYTHSMYLALSRFY